MPTSFFGALIPSYTAYDKHKVGIPSTGESGFATPPACPPKGHERSPAAWIAAQSGVLNPFNCTHNSTGVHVTLPDTRRSNMPVPSVAPRVPPPCRARPPAGVALRGAPAYIGHCSSVIWRLPSLITIWADVAPAQDDRVSVTAGVRDPCRLVLLCDDAAVGVCRAAVEVRDAVLGDGGVRSSPAVVEPALLG